MEETVQRLQPLVRSDLTRCEGGINKDGRVGSWDISRFADIN